MALTRELSEMACRLGNCALLARSDAMLDLERSVYGASFDALNHSEMLCCTPDKLGVLRACRRVARDDARMAFTIIALAPLLTASERQIAIASGPTYVATDDDYEELLGQSGWRLQERIDLTSVLAQCMRAELDGMQARAGALAKVYGADEFAERTTRQQAAVAAIDAGFLRRELFVARPAG